MSIKEGRPCTCSLRSVITSKRKDGKSWRKPTGKYPHKVAPITLIIFFPPAKTRKCSAQGHELCCGIGSNANDWLQTKENFHKVTHGEAQNGSVGIPRRPAHQFYYREPRLDLVVKQQIKETRVFIHAPMVIPCLFFFAGSLCTTDEVNANSPPAHTHTPPPGLGPQMPGEQ